MFVIDREVRELLWSSIQLCVPELDVWLRLCEAHGIAAELSRSVAPEFGVREAIIEAREAEYAEGEC